MILHLTMAMEASGSTCGCCACHPGSARVQPSSGPG